MPEPKTVAALVTEYRRWTHADVILTKLLKGYDHAGGPGPALRLVSLYVDQFPKGDLSRGLAKQHGFRIFGRPEDALTLGGPRLAVDGVLCIAEHGKYPANARGQILYPRRRFFEAAAAVFAKGKTSVPVFIDKHLSATWADAKWVYDKARELYAPLMAGSSLPVTWRRPDLTLPKGCGLKEAVQLGYGPLEGYGFHALEGLQCMAERRRGGETGVAAVQSLRGPAVWQALDAGRWSAALLGAAAGLVPAHAAGAPRAAARGGDAALYLVEYRDGFRAAVAMLNGWIQEGEGGSFVFAGRLEGKAEPPVTRFYLQEPEPFAHFGPLLRAVESLVRTAHAPYPVERTLLTTGVLDALMTSAAEKGRRVETPHLGIKYQPADWPHATGPVPKANKR